VDGQKGEFARELAALRQRHEAVTAQAAATSRRLREVEEASATALDEANTRYAQLEAATTIATSQLKEVTFLAPVFLFLLREATVNPLSSNSSAPR
jgi:chromosome segregation ATPase